MHLVLTKKKRDKENDKREEIQRILNYVQTELSHLTILGLHLLSLNGKRMNGLEFCIVYRLLNSLTRQGRYSLLRTDDTQVTSSIPR